jgi:hypothetical protein
VAFKKLYQENRESQTFQNNVASALNPVLNAPIVNGFLLENISLGVGSNTIAHKLQKQIRGAIVTQKNANSDVYFLQADANAPLINIIVNASVACTVTLWVF